MRIYELAKELGIENKILIAKAQELGMPGKKSHSNALSDDETEMLRKAFEGVANGSAEDLEVLKKKIDTVTGQESTFVERRKGNVVRRRKSKNIPSPAVVAEPEKVQEVKEVETVQEEVAKIEEPVSSPDSIFKDSEPESEVAVVVDDVKKEPITEDEKATKKTGPKILGKIKLEEKKPKPVEKKKKKFETANAKATTESDNKDKKKKKGRKREFSRNDLVDYQGRFARRNNRVEKKKKKGSDDGIKPETVQPKASKRVVKMAADAILVGDLAKQISLKAGEVIGKLMELGVMATINQAIDYDTAVILADEFGYTIDKTGFDEDHVILIEGIDNPELLKPRSPVVTVMGHVDHGKTSLLDYIRKSGVASKEHGGITQHIGAYDVTLAGKGRIAFIDTPGHAAFTQMRARGASVTDVVILVVAADDGVMPQTIEAINHAKAAEVSIVVAINKMDTPGANPDKVKQQLAEHGLQPEDWGGDTMFFPVSAHTGEGIEELLEGLLLVAEVLELKANPDCRVQGTVIEARQEKGRGTVATVLVQSGTLKVGDIFVAGPEFGRVRSMTNHLKKSLKEAPPSTPVEITGLNGVPTAGDDFVVVESDSDAKQVVQKRLDIKAQQDALAMASGPVSLEDFAKFAEDAAASDLRVVIKADVQGSLEAVKQSLLDLSTELVRVKVIHNAIGGVNESDVQLALASNAIIIGFNVRGESRALAEADSQNIDVRFYRVIYELIDDVKKAMAGLLAPIEKEVSLGAAEVRETFSAPKVGTIAGCYVTNGMVKRGVNLRLLRDSVVVYEGKLGTLRRFKDDVKEVAEGYECGLSIDGFNDIKQGDVVEFFEIEEIAATL